MGLEEFIEGDGVCLIEWSEYLEYLLPDSYLKLNITIEADESRVITITGEGKEYLNVEKEIEKLW